MLKEAIAEAKTIRETAIESAKIALEEAFTPQLTAMFAEKLNELELEEKEEKDETNEMYGMEEEGLEENFNLEELLAELEEAELQAEAKDKKDMKTENLEEDLMLEEMSDEEIEELVKSVIDDMIASGKLMAGEEAEDEDMDMDDMDMGDEEEIEDEEETEEIDEDINLEELLAEIDSEKKEVVNEEFFDPETLKLVAQAAEFLNVSKDAIMGMIAGLPGAAVAAAFLRATMKAKKEAKSGKVDEITDTTEMEETINELRNELNEVNLLNAKLLYTNKIFKAKNLTESEKIKVLNTFDKAETVKEVKLVFETLTESFKTTTVKKNPIKESLGSASRTIAPATPKQPIIEVNSAFARMQQLAGLKK